MDDKELYSLEGVLRAINKATERLGKELSKLNIATSEIIFDTTKNRGKVFISGPMTGYPDNNVYNFYAAERFLIENGYSVFNPAWMAENIDDTWSHDDVMAIDIAALGKCDYIYQLDGWHKSKGARMEYAYAASHDIGVLTNIDVLTHEGTTKNYD